MSSSFDVCIVGLKCYDLLTDAKVPRYLGGVEKQLVSLARGLVEEGLRVAFITYDHGQQDQEKLSGITVFKSFEPDGGYPGIRFVHPRMTLLWMAMKRVAAPIYLQMGAGTETGQVAAGCCFGAKFVYLVASDADCDTELSMLSHRRERILYRYGLRTADLVISQTQKQWHLLMDSFFQNSEVLPLPCTWGISPDDYVAPSPAEPGKARILWVGRIIEIKRLEWFIDAAKQCPEMAFDVIGTPNVDSDYYAMIQERAQDVANLTMHGRVSAETIQELYEQASLLCCTSEIEGFPTTFLEAWNYGLPVVSTFDPDGIIYKNGIGCVVETMEELVASLKHLVGSPDEWRALSKISREFFCDNYTVEAILPNFMKLLERVRTTKD